GEGMLDARVVRDQDFHAMARQLVGDLPHALAHHEAEDLAPAARSDLPGGFESVQGGLLERLVQMLGDEKNVGHGSLSFQITLASLRSFSTSVATSGTLMPAFRSGGDESLRIFTLGVTSTPRSAGVSSSTGFFFAFMIPGSDA